MQIESDIDIDTFATAQNNLKRQFIYSESAVLKEKKARTADAHNGFGRNYSSFLLLQVKIADFWILKKTHTHASDWLEMAPATTLSYTSSNRLRTIKIELKFDFC